MTKIFPVIALIVMAIIFSFASPVMGTTFDNPDRPGYNWEPPASATNDFSDDAGVTVPYHQTWKGWASDKAKAFHDRYGKKLGKFGDKVVDLGLLSGDLAIFLLSGIFNPFLWLTPVFIILFLGVSRLLGARFTLRALGSGPGLIAIGVWLTLGIVYNFFIYYSL